MQEISPDDFFFAVEENKASLTVAGEEANLNT